MNLLIISLYLVFVLSALVLIVVILLQEGKGGGFGEALGQAGQQTFGVKARGIQTFTGVAAGIFLVSALLIHIINRMDGSASVVDDLGGVPEAPADGN
ncbi:MAG: preprotein translocase subunit SecG [Planctomycetes bacterium]|jgi:preprotein translocase subunit SecG|nr:preprotein translocase subunit SecG [Planctomycetota bacterium]MDP6410898.1 preprotein translocase subunit SecG [Planctomycetota bacterium]